MTAYVKPVATDLQEMYLLLRSQASQDRGLIMSGTSAFVNIGTIKWSGPEEVKDAEKCWRGSERRESSNWPRVNQKFGHSRLLTSSLGCSFLKQV